GTHELPDNSSSADINALTVERSSRHVGIQRDDPAYPLHVGTQGSNGNGAHVTNGGTWTDGSSRTFKEDLQPVNSARVLHEVLDLPVYRWRYKGSDEGEHMGPVAEDFFNSFQLGDDERYISGVDGDGVALAAIQGLYELVQEQAERITELERRLAEN
ncbi:tail fiber domain-containing protein, partial [Bacteroidota bacterium]